MSDDLKNSDKSVGAVGGTGTPGLQNLTPWQPGQSGNPAGKPKGSKHLSTWIQEMMNDEEFELLLTHPINGIEKYKGAPVKAIVRTALIRSANGDKQWADWLANHGWKQQIDVTTNGKDLPTPILGGMSVYRDDSDKEAPEA